MINMVLTAASYTGSCLIQDTDVSSCEAAVHAEWQQQLIWYLGQNLWLLWLSHFHNVMQDKAILNHDQLIQ